MGREQNINKLALDIVNYLNELEGFGDWWDVVVSDEQMNIIKEIEQMIEDAADYI